MRVSLIAFCFSFCTSNLLAEVAVATFSSTLSHRNFIKNSGQVIDQNGNRRDDIKYYWVNNGLNVYLRSCGLSYQLAKTIYTGEKSFSVTISRVDLEWIGASFPVIRESAKSENFQNFYGRTNIEHVPSFSEITYNHIYPGVGVRLYSHNGSFKYDFIIEPGYDYKKVQINVKGARAIKINRSGEVEISTEQGNIIEGKPKVYQGDHLLNSKWKLTKNVLSFEISDLDPALPLVIDPMVRLWGTYFGNAGTLSSCSGVDSVGNVYIAGSTQDAQTIATLGAHQTTLAGQHDGYISKFDPSGNLLWSTYLGGQYTDMITSCAVARAGNIYVTGETFGSTYGLSSPSAFQTNFGGGQRDLFIVKLLPAGTVGWGTYFGSTSDDFDPSCTIDNAENLYLSGTSGDINGSTALSTTNAYQISNSGIDLILAKFTSAGSRIWSTYFGGEAMEQESACAVDIWGNVILTGATGSFSNIATPSSFCANKPGSMGNNDGFVAKFSNAGQIQWSTYYGGTGIEGFRSCTTDLLGNIYAAGEVSLPTATTIPTGVATTNAYQNTFGGDHDAMIVKFNLNGVLSWGTFYGSSGWDTPNDLRIDKSGNLYMAGTTTSSNTSVIASPNAYQVTFGGTADAFSAKFSPTGTRLWGTYYGGNGNDYSTGILPISPETFYLTGYSASTNSIAISTPGAFQQQAGQYGSAFIAKISYCDSTLSIDIDTLISSGDLCDIASVTLTAMSPWGITWYHNTFANPVGTGQFLSQLISSGTHTFYAFAHNQCAGYSTPTASATISIHALPVVSASGGSICSGQTFTIQPTGADTYSNLTGSMFVSPMQDTTYIIVGIDLNGCADSTTVDVFVYNTPSVGLSLSDPKFCEGDLVFVSLSGGNNYTINGQAHAFNVYTLVATASDLTLTVSTSGTNSCVGTTTKVFPVSDCLDLTQDDSDEIQIFPNPFTDHCRIIIPGNIGNDFLLEISDCWGRQCDVQTTSQAQEIILYRNDLPKGLYFVRINGISGKVFKLIVE